MPIKVKSVKLVNIKNIADFEFTKRKGHLHIIGANGLGKSTIQQVIEYASSEEPGLLGTEVVSVGEASGEAKVLFVTKDGLEYEAHMEFVPGNKKPKKMILKSIKDGGEFTKKSQRDELFDRRVKPFHIDEFISNQSTKAGRIKNFNRYFAPLSNIDLESLNKEKKQQEERRRLAKAEVKEVEAVLSATGLTIDDLDRDWDRVDVSKISQELQEARKIRDLYTKLVNSSAPERELLESYRKSASDFRKELESLKNKRISELEAEIRLINKGDFTTHAMQDAFNNLEAFNDKADDQEITVLASEKTLNDIDATTLPSDDDLEKLSQKLESVEKQNARAETADRLKANVDKFKQAKEVIDESNTRISDIDDTRNDEVARLGSTLFKPPYKLIPDEEDGMPILYLETPEGDVPMAPEQVQKSHLIMAGAEAGMLLMKRGSKLRTITIPDAVLLDEKMQRKLMDKANEHGFDLWMEIVGNEDHITIEQVN